MKTITLVLCIVINCIAQAQEPLPQAFNNPTDTSIGFSFSSELSFMHRYPDPTKINDTINDRIPKFGYSAGISYIVPLNKRIAVETGFYFSNKGETIKSYLLDLGADYKYNHTRTDVLHYEHLDIPLKGRYYLTKNNLGYYLMAGVTQNIFLRRRIQSTFRNDQGDWNSQTLIDKSEIKRYNLSWTAGTGIGFNINRKLTINIEAFYNHSRFSVTDSPDDTQFLSFGINTGIYFKLK